MSQPFSWIVIRNHADTKNASVQQEVKKKTNKGVQTIDPPHLDPSLNE